jgi:sulfur-carrier protein adenylyltransferase/sulfurtransferase
VTWYFSDLARFRAEREGLGVFAESIDWLAMGAWRIGDGARLVLDADIAIGDRIYPVYLQYPEMFPHSPPSVFPRGETGRWSQHQFGPGGELCLEYGPDNWTPDLTGVHLIESAHRLLQGENPGLGEKGIVESRHSDTLGQKLRSEYSRLLITRGFEDFLPELPVRAPATCNFVSSHHKESVIHVIDKISLADGITWSDLSIPSQLANEYMERPAPICRIALDETLPPVSSYQAFQAGCAAFGLTIDHRYAVIVQGEDVHAYFLWEPDNTVAKVAIIPASPDVPRLDPGHALLRSKSVALIGCGSLGSKVGAMLARSGVGRFVLVDDDILLPDNLVRHDLDWRDVGAHKAPALARRLELINPLVQTTRWRARLAGQEANETAEAALKTIGDCDLIFDATANPDILNLVSAVCSVTDKPVFWAEIFGGGIGGLMARCRPNLEPPPQYMRRAIENWFGERGPAPVRSTRSYETGRDGVPLIADDADVSVIAAHAARFAIDTLIGRDPSLFPNSVYAIGLGVGSVFTQPFETYPIEVGPPLPKEPKQELSSEDVAVEIANVLKLFKAKSDEAAAASQNSQTPQT